MTSRTAGPAGDGTAARGRAVVLSGTGRFADAWHPFAGTSARLAAILRDQGFDPEIAGADERMADLDDTRLVVLRRARPRRTVLRLPEHREIISPGRPLAGHRPS